MYMTPIPYSHINTGIIPQPYASNLGGSSYLYTSKLVGGKSRKRRVVKKRKSNKASRKSRRSSRRS